MRQVIIYPDEDGSFVAMCPSLPGCVSEGDTYQETLINIKEAIDLWIEYAQTQGHEIPANYPIHVEMV